MTDLQNALPLVQQISQLIQDARQQLHGLFAKRGAIGAAS